MSSLPLARRRAAILLVLTALLAAALLCSLFIGARTLSPWAVFNALSHPAAQDPDSIVVASRIPRTVAGVLIGLALGLAGALMQALTRNPLAEPGILGINAGASLGVVLLLFTLGTAAALPLMMLAAFLGAAVTILLVYIIASLGREGATPIKLALAGAALAVGLASITNALLMVSRSALDEYRFWQVGVLTARSVPELMVGIIPLAAGVLLVAACANVANAMAMGDDSAAGLGFNVTRARIVGGIGVVLLAGTATALAGPIAFVGLIVPHAMRALIGSDYRWLLPASALAGPVLLLGTDIIGRIIAPPAEVQVGVMCALIGGPLFIVLMRRGLKTVSL
ncbi:FecCD family ABC transporter permease [Glutamicibacter endophyticus]